MLLLSGLPVNKGDIMTRGGISGRGMINISGLYTCGHFGQGVFEGYFCLLCNATKCHKFKCLNIE
jgi:hypothetical protein